MKKIIGVWNSGGGGKSSTQWKCGLLGIQGSGLENRLDFVIKEYKRALNITTCRTSGSTVKAITKHTAYQHIWTSTYEHDEREMQLTLNYLKGKHILNLIEQLELL